jgi:hypothetical protein
LLTIPFFIKQTAMIKSIQAIIVLYLVVASVAYVPAQSKVTTGTCKVQKTAPPTGSWTWAENAHVQVYVRTPDFSAQDVPDIKTALQNWDASAGENGSGVRFEYQGDTREAMTCENCLTITRGETADKRHGAELQGFSKMRDQIINYAWIVIDRKRGKSKSLASIITHELGHSLGLLDCFSCQRNSTVMNQFHLVQVFGINIINLSNEIAKPSVCDIAQVKESYKELRISVRPSPTIASSEPVDEGEEPEEDDTPVVIPEP